MTAQIAKKTVNALITDAEMGSGGKLLVSATGLDVTETILKGFKKVMGGLWVGGTATLYESKIAFQPNAVNAAIHAGNCSIEIPLAEVLDVQVRFGFFTKVIDIVTADGKLSLRCFGAPEFAEKIRKAKHNQTRDR